MKRYIKTPLGFIEIGIEELPHFDLVEQWKADKNMMDHAPKIYSFISKLK